MLDSILDATKRPSLEVRWGFHKCVLSRHPGASGTVTPTPRDLSYRQYVPRGSRYQIIKDLGPKSHNHHGLSALIP